MRADTHDGPEQMLHVRGLIHCCSSHVRRSWNSVLQRTAGPYILARLGRADHSRTCPFIRVKRSRWLRARNDAIDQTRAFALEPSALGLREEVVADDAPFVIDCEKADSSGNHLAVFRTNHVPPEFYDTVQRLDRRGGPEDETFLDAIS